MKETESARRQRLGHVVTRGKLETPPQRNREVHCRVMKASFACSLDEQKVLESCQSSHSMQRVEAKLEHKETRMRADTIT